MSIRFNIFLNILNILCLNHDSHLKVILDNNICLFFIFIFLYAQKYIKQSILFSLSYARFDINVITPIEKYQKHDTE